MEDKLPDRMRSRIRSLFGLSKKAAPAVSRPEPETPDLQDKMRRDWDERARENALYYVATGDRDWSQEEFFRSGRQTVEEFVLSDMPNICRGRDPKTFKVLEIGCGVGRVTRALAEVFGEVCAVDVSPVMVEKAREYLGARDNVSFFVNNGKDLEVLGDRRFDFAFSHLTFQHVPSKVVIASYIAEASRLLRPGALFKFDVQGHGPVGRPPRKPVVWLADFLRHPADNTWFGTPLTQAELTKIADSCGFFHRYSRGEGEQMFYQWLFKKGPATLRADPNPAQPCGPGQYRTVLSWDAPAVEGVEIRIGSKDGTLFTRDTFWGSGEIQLHGAEAPTCFLVDASNHQVLATTVIESGEAFGAKSSPGGFPQPSRPGG